MSSVWGPKALDNIVDLNLTFEVETDKAVFRRQALLGKTSVKYVHIFLSSNFDQWSFCSAIQAVHVRGLVSKFAVGAGRSGTDRQFFYINGRPCAPTKVRSCFLYIHMTNLIVPGSLGTKGIQRNIQNI